jgi:hypothetical protein
MEKGGKKKRVCRSVVRALAKESKDSKKQKAAPEGRSEGAIQLPSHFEKTFKEKFIPNS